MRRAVNAAVAFGIVVACASSSPGQNQVTPVNLKIAFIGDQGLGDGAAAVLQLIQSEGAHAVIHSGDFDYDDDPAAWEAQIDAVLGHDFPYFACIGNHDVEQFQTPGGYQDRLEARLARLGIAWQGNLGVRSSFQYQGIFIVFTAPGILQTNAGHRNFIRGALAADQSIWRIASWHKNMRKMQVGGKSNETGWGVYEAARQGGAIIATAHEHSYSRTHLLSNIKEQTIADTDTTLLLSRDDPATSDDEGRSFVFVSGLGGQSIREQERCMPITPPHGCDGLWASIYTADQGANHGALFAIFNYEGDASLARFYFMDIDGVVADEFFVRAAPVPAAQN